MNKKLWYTHFVCAMSLVLYDLYAMCRLENEIDNKK